MQGAALSLVPCRSFPRSGNVDDLDRNHLVGFTNVDDEPRHFGGYHRAMRLTLWIKGVATRALGWTPGLSGSSRFFRLAGGEPFAFAGLWARWKGPDGLVDSCTILTTDANDVVAPVHGRMPVIVAPADYERWLDPELCERGALEDILQPYRAQAVEGWPVSRQVNNPKVDEPELLEVDQSAAP